MKLSSSSSLLFATLAISSSSSSLAVPVGDGTSSDAIPDSASAPYNAGGRHVSSSIRASEMEIADTRAMIQDRRNVDGNILCEVLQLADLIPGAEGLLDPILGKLGLCGSPSVVSEVVQGQSPVLNYEAASGDQDQANDGSPAAQEMETPSEDPDEHDTPDGDQGPDVAPPTENEPEPASPNTMAPAPPVNPTNAPSSPASLEPPTTPTNLPVRRDLPDVLPIHPDVPAGALPDPSVPVGLPTPSTNVPGEVAGNLPIGSVPNSPPALPVATAVPVDNPSSKLGEVPVPGVPVQQRGDEGDFGDDCE